jgi:hypothetical protein
VDFASVSCVPLQCSSGAAKSFSLFEFTQVLYGFAVISEP